MTKAAFEIRKGTQKVFSLSEAEVMQSVDPAELIQVAFGIPVNWPLRTPHII